MKKLFLMFTFLFLISAMGFALTNETLIDFNIIGDSDAMEVGAEVTEAEGDNDEDGVTGQTRLGDFYVDEWFATLNSSSRIMPNIALTYVTNATSAKYGNVLGVRIHFPTEAWNSYARVAPPYEMSIYSIRDVDGEEGLTENVFTGGKGVITNVQTVKRVTSHVYGRNFPIMMYINIADEDGVISSYPMGYTFFNGWKELQWVNPNYIENAALRALKREPLYPELPPSIRFDSIIFYRPKTSIGGDFVSYVKDIQVEYEPAVFVTEEDINDEATWGIIRTESERRAKLSSERVEEIRALREIEKLRNQASTSEGTTE